jgi:hypothetical protein
MTPSDGTVFQQAGDIDRWLYGLRTISSNPPMSILACVRSVIASMSGNYCLNGLDIYAAFQPEVSETVDGIV